MGCIVEFDKGLRFDFVQNKYKQKLWIDILLKFSKADIEHLAYILKLPKRILVQVYQENYYLDKESAELLGQLLLVALSD
ncbi:MAG: hypothetical protein H0U75_08460 [Legionella sp.]|nr:hypothetical protein [Legionella sp.]